jgi:hypothetical protein
MMTDQTAQPSSERARQGQPRRPAQLPRPIASVIASHRNGPLIAKAATLWIRPGDVVLDMTYGRGKFWTDFTPGHLIAHDR